MLTKGFTSVILGLISNEAYICYYIYGVKLCYTLELGMSLIDGLKS